MSVFTKAVIKGMEDWRSVFQQGSQKDRQRNPEHSAGLGKRNCMILSEPGDGPIAQRQCEKPDPPGDHRKTVLLAGLEPPEDWAKEKKTRNCQFGRDAEIIEQPVLDSLSSGRCAAGHVQETGNQVVLGQIEEK